MRLKWMYWLLLLALVPVSALARQNVNEIVASTAQFRDDSTYANALNKAAYRVGPGDELTITAGPGGARNESFQRTVKIGPDGRISYDLLGSFVVEGRTVDEIDADITRLLGEFIIDVEVTVLIARFEARRVFVVGEVRAPGKYIINRNMSILDAIAEAGTPTNSANLKKVKLIRHGSTALDRDVTIINLKDLMRNGALDKNFALADGDIIYVPMDFLSKVGVALEKLFRPLQPVVYVLAISGLIRRI